MVVQLPRTHSLDALDYLDMRIFVIDGEQIGTDRLLGYCCANPGDGFVGRAALKLDIMVGISKRDFIIRYDRYSDEGSDDDTNRVGFLKRSIEKAMEFQGMEILECECPKGEGIRKREEPMSCCPPELEIPSPGVTW